MPQPAWWSLARPHLGLSPHPAFSISLDPPGLTAAALALALVSLYLDRRELRQMLQDSQGKADLEHEYAAYRADRGQVGHDPLIEE